MQILHKKRLRQGKKEAVKAYSCYRGILVISKILIQQGSKDYVLLIFFCYVGEDDI